MAYGRLGRGREADAELRSVLEAAEQAADAKTQGDAHLTLATIRERNGDNAAALEHALVSLQHHRAAGYASGQGKALNNIGWYYAVLGDPGRALVYCREAIAIQRRIGAPHEANSWDSLGFAYHKLGRKQEAFAAFQRAIELFQNTGDHYGLAESLMGLADIQATDDPDLAQETRRRAQSILDELGVAAPPSLSDS